MLRINLTVKTTMRSILLLINDKKQKGNEFYSLPQTVDKVAKARRIIIAIELYRMAKVTLAKTKSINSVYRKVA